MSQNRIVMLTHKANKSRAILQGHKKILREVFPQIEELDITDGFPVSDEDSKTVLFKTTNDGFLGTEYLTNFAEYLKRFKKVICLVDDYTTPPPTQIRNSLRETGNGIAFSMIPKEGINFSLRTWNWCNPQSFFYVNWNAASYDLSGPRIPAIDFGVLFYHGTYRPNRHSLFQKYLQRNPKYKTVISCSSERAMMKFKDAGIYPDELFISDSPLRDQISRYGFALYIEDEWSSKSYTSPANRFYESLSAGTPLLFDEACRKTFKIYDPRVYEILKPFFVNSRQEVGYRILGLEVGKQSLKDEFLSKQILPNWEPRQDLKVQILESVKSLLEEEADANENQEERRKASSLGEQENSPGSTNGVSRSKA